MDWMGHSKELEGFYNNCKALSWSQLERCDYHLIKCRVKGQSLGWVLRPLFRVYYDQTPKWRRQVLSSQWHTRKEMAAQTELCRLERQQWEIYT